MASSKLAERVSSLEAEVARLKERIEEPAVSSRSDWRSIVGSFANDPAFEEAMRLGREWRESFRPKKRTSKTKSANGSS
jgi:hypothetical protein